MQMEVVCVANGRGKVGGVPGRKRTYSYRLQGPAAKTAVAGQPWALGVSWWRPVAVTAPAATTASPENAHRRRRARSPSCWASSAARSKLGRDMHDWRAGRGGAAGVGRASKGSGQLGGAWTWISGCRGRDPTRRVESATIESAPLESRAARSCRTKKDGRFVRSDHKAQHQAGSPNCPHLQPIFSPGTSCTTRWEGAGTSRAEPWTFWIGNARSRQLCAMLEMMG
jgi:hypothetical protein